ncbi:hypothetical protein PG985_014525 [Apiospora marii]|uniref:uncharacterized protein n=1 Tax=Apiospora marii TaxID=335849 RepID=UPI00312DBD7D
MVGKSWSDAEERYFWRHVVPFSTSRAGIFVGTNEGDTWDELARRMAAHFGDDGRREYGHAVLYEHWFLNQRIGTRSPNAEPYLSRYFRRAGVPSPYANPAPAAQGQAAAAATAGSSGAPSAPAADPSGAEATASPTVQGAAPGRAGGVPALLAAPTVALPPAPAPGPAAAPVPVPAPAAPAEMAPAPARAPEAEQGSPAGEGSDSDGLYSGLPATFQQRRIAQLQASSAAAFPGAPSSAAAPPARASPSTSAPPWVEPPLARDFALPEPQQLGRTRARTRAQQRTGHVAGSTNPGGARDRDRDRDQQPPAPSRRPSRPNLHPRDARRTEYSFGSSGGGSRRRVVRPTPSRTASQNLRDVNYYDSNESATSDSDDIPAILDRPLPRRVPPPAERLTAHRQGSRRGNRKGGKS